MYYQKKNDEKMCHIYDKPAAITRIAHMVTEHVKAGFEFVTNVVLIIRLNRNFGSN